MPDPKEHADNRGAIETILRFIPGFRGYLEKEYRRESDRLARAWLAEKLQRAKGGLDGFSRAQVDAGRIDALPPCDRVRGRLDRLIARLAGGVQGYSGFFDFVDVDEDVLDDVYDHDMGLLSQVDALAGTLENLATQTGVEPEGWADLLTQIESIGRGVDRRVDLLAGLGPN